MQLMLKLFDDKTFYVNNVSFESNEACSSLLQLALQKTGCNSDLRTHYINTSEIGKFSNGKSVAKDFEIRYLFNIFLLRNRLQ